MHLRDLVVDEENQRKKKITSYFWSSGWSYLTSLTLNLPTRESKTGSGGACF